MKLYAFADEASPLIDRQIAAMKRNGLDGLEIRNVDGVNISDISAEKAKEVRSKMDEAGLSVWSIGSPIGKIGIEDDFARHLDLFRHTLELAEILGAPNIRLFSFYIPKDRMPQSCTGEVIERMGQLLDAAKGYRVTCCHENEKGIYGDIPERCLELHRTFPELKGVFDPANFVQCQADTKAAWELLKEYILYMHIKDARENGIVVPAGQGIGHVKEIAAAFLKKGGSCFTIEPHLTEFYGLADLERDQDRTHWPAERLSEQEAFDLACRTFRSLMTGISV